MSRIACLSLLLACPFALWTCSKEEGPTKRPRTAGAEHYDTSPIDLTSFPADPVTYQRVLAMRFGEAAARLGSLQFSARSHFVFSRGAVEIEQTDTYLVAQDSQGNFRVLLDTPEAQIEIMQVNEKVFVRHDKGHLREKPRRELEMQSWRDLAFSSMQQVLSLFRARLMFGEPTLDKSTPHPALRFGLSLADRDLEVPVPTTGLDTSLPVSPPARWRELARALDLRGDLWLDATTGVVTKLTLEGRLEIADRQVRPTQLSIRYEAAVTDAGKVTTVKATGAVPEFERRRRTRDPLSFFRDQLPQLPPPESKPAASP